MVSGILDDGMNSQRAARSWPLRAADRRRIKADLFPFGIECANGCFGLVHHDFSNLLLWTALRQRSSPGFSFRRFRTTPSD